MLKPIFLSMQSLGENNNHNTQWSAKKMLTRMAAAYGTRIYQILGSHEMPADLGQNFGFDLYSAEIDYLVDQEWARTADDILLRRTKLGLYFDKTMTEQLKSYLEYLIFCVDKLASTYCE